MLCIFKKKIKILHTGNFARSWELTDQYGKRMSKESSTTKHRLIARTEKVKETTFQGTDIKKITSSAETFKYVTYRILSLHKNFSYLYTTDDKNSAYLFFSNFKKLFLLMRHIIRSI